MASPKFRLDVVVAMHSTPLDSMLRALLAALPNPSAVHTSVWIYPKLAMAKGDAETLRENFAALRGGGRLHIAEPHLPNVRRWFHSFGQSRDRSRMRLNRTPPRAPQVGRCDHTYLHHIVERYASLADATVFIKDTTFRHHHHGYSSLLLTLLARLPHSLSTDASWCARPRMLAPWAFEMPEYQSEMCRHADLDR